MTKVTLEVNGESVACEVDAETMLIDLLHENLDLTGTKFCCGIGVCRACTVLVHKEEGALGVPTLSCSTPAVSVDGQQVVTVEGLGQPDALSPLQQAFLDHFSFQCGYCAPGFLMAATELVARLQRSPVALADLDQAIMAACGEHVCRCTGYTRYHEAIRAVVLATEGAVR